MATKKQKIALVSLFLTSPILITWPLFCHLGTSIYGSFFGTDMRGAIWSLWWRKWAIYHQLDLNLCPFVAAPFGLNLGNQPIFWIVHFLMNFCLSFLNPAATLNILTLLSFTLTGLITFMCVNHLTKNFTASCISAVIFTFSPYHINKVAEFSFFMLGNWLILYIATLLWLNERVTWQRVVCAGIALTLTAAFNFYYAFFAIIFTLLLCIYKFLYRWKNQKLNKKICARLSLRFIVAILSVFTIALFLNLPSILPLINKFLYARSHTMSAHSDGYVRSFSYLISQSARPMSYLLPASTHPIFGSFTKKMFGSIFYGRGSVEQTLYLGWFPLILAYVAFKQWRQKKYQVVKNYCTSTYSEDFYIGFFIFLACSAFIFSMPPYIDLGIFKIYLPTYFFYKLLPMFRAYARFGVLVSFSVAVLAGYGIKYYLEKIKNTVKKTVFTAAACFIIFFEFTNIPPFRVTDISKPPRVYEWLAQEKGDFIIAEYPMATVSLGEAWENYDYLYYQTIHQKRMINGAALGSLAYEIKKKILKIDDPKTVKILKNLGVKYMIFHSEPYRKGEYKEAIDVIGEIPQLDKITGLKLVRTFGDIFVYEITRFPEERI